MIKNRWFLSSLMLLLLLSQLSACGLKKTAASITSQIMKDGIPSVEEEDDLAYANQASLSSLKLLEAMQRANPNDATILFMLTRSFGSYTFGFVENDILEAKGSNETFEKLATDRAKRFYSRGKKFGLQLLSKNGSFKKSLDGSLDSFKNSLRGFHKQDVPALFWTAFNWGSLINFSKESPDAIAELSRVEAMMNRVLELDEDYYYSSPHEFFGILYASRPPMLGGKPELAKKEFDHVIERTSEKYLMAKVLYAQFYAVQVQNKPLYEKLLREVLSSDAAALPEQRLSNELAKRRAQILLQKEKLFF